MVLEIRSPRGGHRMAFGVRCDSDVEVGALARKGDEVDRALEVSRRLVGAILRHVSVEGEEVLDAVAVVAREDRFDLFAGVRDAGEVRHGRDPESSVDVRHDFVRRSA